MYFFSLMVLGIKPKALHMLDTNINFMTLHHDPSTFSSLSKSAKVTKRYKCVRNHVCD
jgi:hypothetical protein